MKNASSQEELNSDVREAFLSSNIIRGFIAEGFPDEVQRRIQLRDSALAFSLYVAGIVIKPEYVLTKLLRWRPGQTITVAFNGGDLDLHEHIVSSTQAWTQEANIKLDFGYNSETNRYRTWSTEDVEYTADIRIAFFTEEKYKGYWSNLGRDSINKEISPPNEPSLNLHGFDSNLPPISRFIIIHEFGHALGLKHEHQHPTQGCESEVRWEDDPGYALTYDDKGGLIEDDHGRKPGIYTILGGPPNNWPRDKVDSQIRNLPEEHAYDFSDFDYYSVMKYIFPASWLKGGDTSRCYGTGPNLNLSDKDKEGIKFAYPWEENAVLDCANEKNKIFNLLSSINLKHSSLEWLLGYKR